MIDDRAAGCVDQGTSHGAGALQRGMGWLREPPAAQPVQQCCLVVCEAATPRHVRCWPQRKTKLAHARWPASLASGRSFSKTVAASVLSQQPPLALKQVNAVVERTSNHRQFATAAAAPAAAHLSFLAILLQATAVHHVGHGARKLLHCYVVLACLQQQWHRQKGSGSRAVLSRASSASTHDRLTTSVP